MNVHMQVGGRGAIDMRVPEFVLGQHAWQLAWQHVANGLDSAYLNHKT